MKTKLTMMALTLAVVTPFISTESVYAQDATPAADAVTPAPEVAEPESMVITEGVEPGKFTHDYDAALAYAKENDTATLLIFTGSDWCGWCKLMDKNVFGTPVWGEFAKKNLAQVWLDFPKNKDLVPEKYRARNKDLSSKYGVRGYPTYFILDSDGNTLGKLGAGRDKTPESFKAEVQKLLIMTSGGIKAFAAELKPEDAATVLKSFDDYTTAKKAESEMSATLKALKEEMVARKEALEKAMEAGKVNSMSDLEKAEYQAAIDALEKAKGEFAAWAKKNSGVKPTPELRKTYNELNKAVQAAQSKVDSF